MRMVIVLSCCLSQSPILERFQRKIVTMFKIRNFLFSQVKTRLHHPTKYHVQQKQKNQIQMFMQQERNTPLTTQSLPDNMVQQQQQQHYTGE